MKVLFIQRPLAIVFLSLRIELRADNEPHLSLMNFSFVVEETHGGVFIMSTRRDTRKFSQIAANPHVAVLVHDFHTVRPTNAGAAGTPQPASGTCSVTVYGDAVVLDNEEAVKFREYHTKTNPAYSQFIHGKIIIPLTWKFPLLGKLIIVPPVGDGIAIFIIKPTKARICNIKDEVQTWAA